MDIIEILHKDEFKKFYEMSKNIYKPGAYKYHSAISINAIKEFIHSVKFYFGTYQKLDDVSLLTEQFKKADIDYLYNLWDIDNLDNKGLSFCIKYYPEKNKFKYQIHCKVRTINTFKNLIFSHNNCRYGIGIEDDDSKKYINVKGYEDKKLIGDFFNNIDLTFFDELEYCEFNNNSKVVTSYNNQKKYILDNFIKKHINDSKFNSVLLEKGLELRNIGIYRNIDLQSFYYYCSKDGNIVDSYEPFYQ